mmetsp:Transcript_38671/g.34370  ORF Transcript_38671/g.34370 Transcript_38671/m.34370 type:complete len:100 (-) Transcript_38671:527-826(-)|eukprot:CAMPEP_0114594882 /NCGR_PEP_ID=MMETSP0125-20121206/16594_1 /TAXON_ID=485358 ORGANISM="Aristerostoma sp., Strain ATCC 50986" /NCGR_SAMPLE_ID=MMETSP0125 /ASSEMBLY_ACC=CAM_ASM_000245 /LENGTH=99 /DNA_ID=CAMNT_0001795741 /DNA_START=794 /DNA_END=1093 /DNA_ORIENTATION=-
MTKEQFIDIVAGNLPKPPKYFFFDAAMNKNGYTPIDEIYQKNLKSLSFDQIKSEVSNGALIIDTRDQKEVINTGMIPGSVAVSLSMNFAIWIGTLLDPQ